jgi:N6-adenosine-specific RNA methylase IME4
MNEYDAHKDAHDSYYAAIKAKRMRGDHLPIIPKRGQPVTAAALVAIEQQIAELIPIIDDFEWLEETRAQARALETYLRDKEMQAPMLGTQRRIEARLGQLLGDVTQGTRIDLTPHRDEKLDAIDNDQTRSDFRLLANALNGLRLDFEEWRKSRRALIKLIRYRLGLQPELIPLPDGIFRCIVADPPWEQTTGPAFKTFAPGNEPLDYPTMTVEQIRDMPVADRAAADAHLYLWTINKYVEQTYEIARAWGFTPSTLLVWAKTPMGVGIGGDFRLTAEFCLFCRRGNLPALTITPTTWFNWPRGIHSQKPDSFFDMVQQMTPAPDGDRDRLELFSRRQRNGWTVWGNEVANA